MINRLLQRLTGQTRDYPRAVDAASETYKGFTIHATPRKNENGWRVAGRIEKPAGESARCHEFIRADAFPDQQDAVTVTLRKARQMIDQMGESLFER